PEMVLGALKATVTACHYGEREFLKLVDKHGLETFLLYVEGLLDYTERLTREEIRALPAGTYRFEDWLDDDGMVDQPIPLKLALTIKEDSIVADYTGSSAQVRGALNATLSFTKACTYLA